MVHPPRLLFLVTEDWYFCAHRLNLARAARDAGYHVMVATRVVGCAALIEREGFEPIALNWRRGSTNPLATVTSLFAVMRLYRRCRPDIVHNVSLKPALIGSLAAIPFKRIAIVNAITGLGYTFTAQSFRARTIAGILRRLLGWLMRRPRSIVLFENEDDRKFFAALGVPRGQTAVAPGSGVDLGHYGKLPPPDNDPIVIGCAARLLAVKGISDLIEASQILRRRGVAHRILLAGDVDAENPDTISDAQLQAWAKDNLIERLGHLPDIRELWAQADIATLPSRGGEGVPLSLVEAAACGRPLVATDVPGCRDIARDGVNAVLVPPRNPQKLADALERLIKDAPLRQRLADESRGVAREFSAERVNATTLALYDRLLRDAVGERRAERPVD
jgi:glycosyltransferase involved in cell wall biosynthesis